jgi:hypothetical protein
MYDAKGPLSSEFAWVKTISRRSPNRTLRSHYLPHADPATAGVNSQPELFDWQCREGEHPSQANESGSNDSLHTYKLVSNSK